MAVGLIPNDIIGIKFVEQASWAGGDPGAGYTALRAFDISFKPEQKVIPVAYQKPEGCRGPDPAVPAGEGGTLTFKTYMRGGNGSESEFSLLAKNCGLARSAQADDTDNVTASAAGTVDIDAGCYAALSVGEGFLVSGSSTDTQLRFISDKDGSDTFTIEPNWADNPANTDDSYALDTIYPDDASLGEPAAYMCFQIFEGQGGGSDSNKWTLTGCAGTWKIVIPGPNELPYVEWTYQVDAFTWTTASASDTADSYGDVEATLGDPFYLGDTATYLRSLTFDPGIKMVPYEATSGTHGRKGWIYVGAEPKLEVEVYWDPQWVTDMQTPTQKQMTFEVVKDTNEAWGLHFPSVQIMNPNPEAVGDLKGLKPELLLTDPGTASTDGSNIPLWAIAVTGSGS